MKTRAHASRRLLRRQAWTALVGGLALSWGDGLRLVHAQEAAAAQPPPERTPKTVTKTAPTSSDAEEPLQVAVYLQLLGAPILIGGAFSLRPLDELAVDVGMGWFDVCLFSCTRGLVPSLGVSWLSGGNHNLELGASASAILRMGDNHASDAPHFFAGPLAGYRYQPRDGGFFFRAHLQGIITFGSPAILPWPGLSLGATWD